MSELTDLIEIIKGNISTGTKTNFDTWSSLLELLEGKNDVETWDNYTNCLTDNFTFKISEGAEGYVYFGKMEGDIGIWEYVESCFMK